MDVAQRAHYTTKPGGSIFFPMLATPTGEFVIRKSSAEPSRGGAAACTRQQARIEAERRINEQCLRRQRLRVEELRKRRESLAASEPPPF